MVATAIYSVAMVSWKETAFPLFQSRGKALEKECCLPGVFCDSGDTPANLLCELNGHLIIIIIIIMQRLTRHVSVISTAIYMLRTGFRLNNDAAKCSDIT